MATFFNNNQILAAFLLPSDSIKFKVGGQLFPYGQVFHSKEICDKRMLTIAYKDGNIYRSLATDQVVSDYDAVIDNVPVEKIPLIVDTDDINFKSSPDLSAAGKSYTNKLEYSLPRITAEEMEGQKSQLALLQSGSYHLLIQLFSCDRAYTIILCPEPTSFLATVQNDITRTNVSITIKNLTSHQFLKS